MNKHTILLKSETMIERSCCGKWWVFRLYNHWLIHLDVYRHRWKCCNRAVKYIVVCNCYLCITSLFDPFPRYHKLITNKRRSHLTSTWTDDFMEVNVNIWYIFRWYITANYWNVLNWKTSKAENIFNKLRFNNVVLIDWG